MTPNDDAPPLLDPAVREEVLALHGRLLDAGELPDDATLDREYALFRDRFGPSVLRDLDGEALLTLMHEHGNPDSLVYWLEFKNDDEFATRKFGSIKGGSALKFGLFRRKETGRWQAGVTSGNKPENITDDEAVGYARRHRDQLLAGCEALEALPEAGTDDDYRRLEERMTEVAPDVSRLAWGHKYFSLLFPTKLDDWHSPELQRLHLIRLGLTPPGEINRERRYRCAGLILAAARELELRVNHFARVMNRLRGGECAYWRVGTDEGDTGKTHWPIMRDNGGVAVGWPELGDLSWLTESKEDWERLKNELLEKCPNSPQAVGNARAQVGAFVATIAEGDVVLAASGQTVLGVGRVTGEYEYRPDLDDRFPHRRPVEWVSLGEWQLPDPKDGLRSICRPLGKKSDENLLAIEHVLRTATPPDVIRKGSPEVAGRPLRLVPLQERIKSALTRKGQAALYGPPGTGKTYWAVRTARDLAAEKAFGRRFDDLDDGQQDEVAGRGAAAGLVRQCCFHPGYGYEDFLEGYRPVANGATGDEAGGALTFVLRDGLFKTLCRDASADPGRHYLLVIDELNRGDVPRIFGELIAALEVDKRGEPIRLAVSGEPFSVPKNVFLIGTMNTADRSVALLDAALRRRFGFLEMMPDPGVLGDAAVAGVPLGPWLAALNGKVRAHVGRDARNLQVGHSYLMSRGVPLKDVAALRRVVRDDILPLLQEYCYEDYAALAKILGTAFIDAEGERVKNGVFDPAARDEFVNALLAVDAGLSTTGGAVAADIGAVDDDVEGEGEDGSGS